MSELPSPVEQRRHQWSATFGRPIRALMALDDSSSCEGAIHVMGALSCLKRAELSVLSVVEPKRQSAWCDQAGSETGETRREAVRRLSIQRRLVCACPAHASRPVAIMRGDVVATLATRARDPEVELLVTGMDVPDARPTLRDETGLRLVRRCATPIFAVAATARRAPERIVAGVDFTSAGLGAARTALRLAGREASLLLVYVNDAFLPSSAPSGLPILYDHLTSDAFDRFLRELDVPAGIHVETLVLGGHPFHELAAFAARAKADLVALGLRRVDPRRQPSADQMTRSFLQRGTVSLILAH